MGGSCLFTLNGAESNAFDVVKILRSFEARKEQFRPQVQPLQVLAYETALLAGHTVNDDDEALAKKALISLSSFSCIASKKKRKRVQQCFCDECVSFRLGYDEYEKHYCEGPAQKELELVHSKLNLFYSWHSQEIKQLQEKLFNQLLGKEVASHVSVRFGSFSCNNFDGPHDDPKIFLYLKNNFQCWENEEYEYKGTLTCVDVDDLPKPSLLERWAFFKAVTLLGLSDCNSGVPKRIFSFVADSDHSG